MATTDNKRHNDWQGMKKSGATNDNEWQRVVQQVAMDDNE